MNDVVLQQGEAENVRLTALYKEQYRLRREVDLKATGATLHNLRSALGVYVSYVSELAKALKDPTYTAEWIEYLQDNVKVFRLALKLTLATPNIRRAYEVARQRLNIPRRERPSRRNNE